MKVVFMQSVEGTAQAGEVKDVKNGFARNFLLPRGLAAPAVEPYLKRAQTSSVREAKHQEEVDQEAGGLAERLEGSRITILARVGEQGKLYGSVTSVRIAEEVAKLINAEEFEHRKVLLPEAIKDVGVQPVRLRLTRNVEAAIEVEVLAEGEDGQPLEVQPSDEAGDESEAEASTEEPEGATEGAAETAAEVEEQPEADAAGDEEANDEEKTDEA